MSKQHDELEAPAAMEKRLGITAKTRKAAERCAVRMMRKMHRIGQGVLPDYRECFNKGAAWERRRRAKDGY